VVYGLSLGLISGPSYAGIGLQEGQVLKASPCMELACKIPRSFTIRSSVKVTTETEIVVKLTANDPKSMTADYARRCAIWSRSIIGTLSVNGTQQ